ncbi:MAG TPA: MarR family transcriptional regulator [Patescibacteria group bacterium]
MKINLPDNEKALWILKMRGAQPLAALATELQVTTEGARFQLLKLANEGLVQAGTLSKGRGRPQQIWSLTASGHARFPDTHAELTVRLIQKMKEELGEAALQSVIEANGQEGVTLYLLELKGVTDLGERVRGLARIRDREGYMTEYKKDKEGHWLIENHCPICAAAQACQGFCQSELNTFRTIFGKGVKVERVDHLLAGARRCAYLIQ